MSYKALARHHYRGYVRYTPIRNVSDKEKEELYDMLDTKPEIKYRAKIILVAAEGYTVPEIREMTNTYDKTIRKWIHRFNDKGTKGLFTEIDYSRMIKIDDKVKREILRISSTSPRTQGLKFSTWSLRSIAGYARERKIAKSISHTTVRNVLRDNSVEWRNSKTILAGKSRDLEYDLKKSILKELKNNTPIDAIILFEDEKGPIAAKTYGGTSWCSTQVKVERAQKTRGILNVFGVYDYTNDRMFIHCYKKRNSKQFLDFIGRVDSLYDSTIKRIFVILDNISIHRAKKVRKVILSHHPRITFVFLPTRSPELNLIEVRWMWLQRKAINNSTFTNEHDVGKAVNDWTENYNATHGRRINDILQIGIIDMIT